MFYIVLVMSAIVCYLSGGVNGAIILSNVVYHEDIRKCGSGNPGFTNFKRVYGLSAVAWSVMLIDILKTVLPVFLSMLTFSLMFEMGQFGAAVAGFCCMLGHCFPIWYGFKGGKAFVTGFTTLWFVDWRMGLISMILFFVVLATTRFMSLASCTALIAYPVALAFLGVSSWVVELIAVLSALLVVLRHWKNFVRLAKKQESKFSLKSKKSVS